MIDGEGPKDSEGRSVVLCSDNRDTESKAVVARVNPRIVERGQICIREGVMCVTMRDGIDFVCEAPGETEKEEVRELYNEVRRIALFY